MRKTYTLLLFGILLLLASACEKEQAFVYQYYTPEETQVLSQYLNLPEIPDDYTVRLSRNLKSTGLLGGTIQREKALLGRVLFYDKHLSKDEKISCASCHKQELGFSDDKPVSLGVFNRAGTRNAIALASVASFVSYYGTDINGQSAIRFFWDNRAATARQQNKGSLNNPLEMGMDMGEVVAAVENQPYYQPLFRKAYGNSEVNADRVNEAIAEFVNAMFSCKSKFDQEASKDEVQSTFHDFPGFTESENRGKAIYMDNCASCHTSQIGRPALYFANNGLDAAPGNDLGVGGISGITAQKGSFKVPTLRNIELTAPYMHDGRFQTLAEVVEHYNSGVQDNPNLHQALRLGPGQAPKRLNLTETDKQDLITFLHTLTDETMRTDPRFSNPFK